MIKPFIEPSYDEVKIENHIVMRPSMMSAKQWIDFWEAVVEMDPEKEERLLEEIKNLEREVEDLKDEAEDLKDRIIGLEHDIDTLEGGED